MSDETDRPSESQKLKQATRRKRVVCVFVLTGTVVFVAYWAYGRFSPPDIGEPFDVEAFASYALPKERNAFIHYRKAIEIFVPSNKVLGSDPAADPQQFVKSKGAAEEDWQHAIPTVRRWVAINRGTLDEMRLGAEFAEGLGRPLSEILNLGMDFENGSQLRECAQLEALEGARQTAEGRTAEAWNCYRNLLRLSRHVAMHSPLMCSFIGNAIGDVGVRGGVCWSAQKSVGATDLKKAIRDVVAVEEMKTPASDTIKAEYLGLRAFAGKGIIYGSTSQTWVRFTGYPARFGRSARLIVANLLSQADRPRYLRTPVHPGVFNLFELDPTSPPNPMLHAPEEIERSAITTVSTVSNVLKRIAPEAASEIEAYDPREMIRTLYAACQVEDSALTRRNSLLLALALQLHYREHGEFPASLNELVTNGYLASIPADPYGKGEPFRYRRETAPHGGAAVWSVWLDGIDQSGVDLHFGGDDWGILVSVPGTPSAPSQ